MKRSKHLAIACSTLLIAAWSTQGVADDNESKEKASRSETSSSSAVTPGTTSPLPSTQRTEGTAADRTIPGATPTRTTEAGTANPLPATSRTEGTAADRTPPGETEVRGAAAKQAPEKATSRIAKAEQDVGSKGTTHALRGSSLIGLEVQDTNGAVLGTVKDIVVDPADGQITYAVVSMPASRGDAASFVVVPWKTFGKTMQDDRVVLDSSRFGSAPQITQSELRNIGQDSWRDAADRHWDRTKTAEAETAR